MEWIINQLRVHPELAIFLTLFAGFWIGRLKIGKFSLGTVTSVLLVGVLVGQLDITVDGPMKAVFFLLFLFAVGYKVGPQFFRGLKKDGLPQVGFAVLMCIVSLVSAWALAKIMGYHVGEAAGLLAGSQTISAVIGVAEDTINGLSISDAQKATFINAIPVAYAVTYIFGTAGSAWILASLGPKFLGGLEKVKADCRELEAQMGSSEADEPGFAPALRPVVFRAYKITNKWFGKGKRVTDLESYLNEQGKRLFVERIRQRGVVKEVTPNLILKENDEVVLSGRREFVIGEEDWLGPEVIDAQRTEKRRFAPSGVCRTDVYRQPCFRLGIGKNNGLPRRGGSRTISRFTNDFRRYRSGRRYNQRTQYQRCAKSHFHQCNSRGICRNLYFRYSRLRLDTGITRSEIFRWAGKSKSRLPGTGSSNGELGSR